MYYCPGTSSYEGNNMFAISISIFFIDRDLRAIVYKQITANENDKSSLSGK